MASLYSGSATDHETVEETHSEDSVKSATLNPDALPETQTVSGHIKWFDSQRGFGFLVPDAESDAPTDSDILIHWSVLEPLGRRDLPEQAAVTCEYVEQVRPWAKFESMDQLIAQIASDVQACKEILGE